MNIFVGKKLSNQVLEKVEKELGRELTVNELEVFWKTSRIALLKGYHYKN